MSQHSNVSVATIRVGGREYPAVFERTCRTCCSPYRRLVETQTVEGQPWKVIVEALPDDANLTARNLSDHFRNQHLPVANEAVQRLAEQHATERGEVVEAGASRIVDYLGFAQTVMGRVNERVATGEIEPGIGDGLRAADLLGKYDPGPTMNESDFVEAFKIYHATARAILTPEQFENYAQRLDANPVLQNLARRFEEVHAQHGVA